MNALHCPSLWHTFEILSKVKFTPKNFQVTNESSDDEKRRRKKTTTTSKKVKNFSKELKKVSSKKKKKKRFVTSDDDLKMAFEPVQDISDKSDDKSPTTKRKVKTETEPETVSEPKKKKSDDLPRFSETSSTKAAPDVSISDDPTSKVSKVKKKDELESELVLKPEKMKLEKLSQDSASDESQTSRCDLGVDEGIRSQVFRPTGPTLHPPTTQVRPDLFKSEVSLILESCLLH